MLRSYLAGAVLKPPRGNRQNGRIMRTSGRASRSEAAYARPFFWSRSLRLPTECPRNPHGMMPKLPCRRRELQWTVPDSRWAG